MSSMRLLLQAYPELDGKIPWMKIGDYPTPAHRLEKMGAFLEHDNLYIKREDMCSSVYSGNKIRKFENVLAHAKSVGAKTLVTVGGTGSNHCLATAIYGKPQGFDVITCIFDQPFTKHCEDVLKLLCHFGAEIHYTQNYAKTATHVIGLLAKLSRKGRAPYFIYSGASTPMGTVGYLEAVLELKQQVKEGMVPEPDILFVPAGSGGTFAGLALGVKLFGMKTRVIGVRVVPAIACNRVLVSALAKKTLKLVKTARARIPDIEIHVSDFLLEHEYFGGAYGVVTKESLYASEKMKTLEGISCEGVYTGKTIAAMMDCEKQNKNKTILYWHTHNSVDFEPILSQSVSLSLLPAPLRRLIEAREQTRTGRVNGKIFIL